MLASTTGATAAAAETTSQDAALDGDTVVATDTRQAPPVIDKTKLSSRRFMIYCDLSGKHKSCLLQSEEEETCRMDTVDTQGRMMHGCNGNKQTLETESGEMSEQKKRW